LAASAAVHWRYPALDLGARDIQIDRLRSGRADDLERQARLGQEILGAVAIGEF
jgi:hypothetical protein